MDCTSTPVTRRERCTESLVAVQRLPSQQRHNTSAGRHVLIHDDIEQALLGTFTDENVLFEPPRPANPEKELLLFRTPERLRSAADDGRRWSPAPPAPPPPPPRRRCIPLAKVDAPGEVCAPRAWGQCIWHRNGSPRQRLLGRTGRSSCDRRADVSAVPSAIDESVRSIADTHKERQQRKPPAKKPNDGLPILALPAEPAIDSCCL
jgi:hypothetical protein